MDWTELCLTVDAADTDRAAAIAGMAVPYGIYIEDYRDLERDAREIAHIDLIDEELLSRDRTHSRIHLYVSAAAAPGEAEAFIAERLRAEKIDFSLDTSTINEQDWANNWKAFFKPLPIGERLLICPTWEQAGETEGRQVLSIDPGMAFGTGGHETTRLVLEAMEPLIDGATVLDVGCGSGILAIAALLLGAKCATGVDIDPMAVQTARENAVLNGLEPPRCVFEQGNLADRIHGQFDLIAANIVADAIIALSPDIPSLLAPNGRYIVSGIIDTREQDVLPVLDACGFDIEQRFALHGWVCLVLRKR